MVKKLLDFSNPTTWVVWGEDNSPSFSHDLSHLPGVLSGGIRLLRRVLSTPQGPLWLPPGLLAGKSRCTSGARSLLLFGPGVNEVHALHRVVMFI